MENIEDTEKEFGIYIHIPFCIRKCAYCDFLSFSAKEQKRKEYIKALTTEMDLFFQSEEYRDVPTTVFIGGGTPSVLEAEQICEILSHIPKKEEKTLDLQRNTKDIKNKKYPLEITMEANPGTLHKEKLKAYYQAGINRLSLGLQSSNNQELKLLGRIHTWEDFLENYYEARQAGFKNINIDLMLGLPGQRKKEWEAVLEKIAELAPEHISAYSLMIEENTPFFLRYKNHPELLPSEEEVAIMYELTGQVLHSFGYEHYEISNYAYPNKECIHNMGYWYRKPYRGFGLGAASLLKTFDENGVEREKRFRNTNKMEEYLLLTKQETTLQEIQREQEILTKEEQMEETMFLGLRCKKGVSSTDFFKKFDISIEELYGDIIKKYSELNLLIWKEDRLCLTEKAFLISNVIMQDFLL